MPQVEDIASLASRFEHVQAEAMVELALESRPVAGGWCTFGGPGTFVNKACGLGLSGPVPPGVAEEVIDFFRSRGAEPRVELCSFVHRSLLEALGRSAFQLQEFENVFYRRLEASEDFRARLPHPWPAGLEVERLDASDAAAVEEYVAVSSSGFFPEGETPSTGFRESALRAARLQHADGFLARLDGRVVGAGGCASRQGLTTLFGTSVLPDFRRRGVQQALMVARLERARARGSTLATIVSHPGISTERNAARLGFSMAFVRAVLVRPGEGLVPSP
jgi:GNAT superfamily N-acetyltransferase